MRYNAVASGRRTKSPPQIRRFCAFCPAFPANGNRLLPAHGKARARQPDAHQPIRMSEDEWCGREDSNFHGFYPTATSTLRVYQFRHDRTVELPNTGPRSSRTRQGPPCSKLPGLAQARFCANRQSRAVFGIRCRRRRRDPAREFRTHPCRGPPSGQSDNLHPLSPGRCTACSRWTGSRPSPADAAAAYGPRYRS